MARNEKNKNVLIVQGARQTGKTFLVENLLNTLTNHEIKSFNLERESIFRNEIEQCVDFDDFTKVLNKYGYAPKPNSILFIDEAQEARKLGAFIRFMKEEWNNVSVILSGSSISKLFSGDIRVPVGRVEFLRVTPLTFQEFVEAKEKSDLLNSARLNPDNISDFIHNELLNTFDDYLKIGGLPSVVNKYLANESIDEITKTRSEIYYSQEEDFFRKEIKLKKHLFQSGTRAAADLLGFPFSMTRISQNHRDAKATLETLCEWLITYKCDQKTFSPTSEPRPKIYLYDVGLANQLRSTAVPNTGINTISDPILRTALGGLVENAIYLQMQQGKNFLNQLSGWRKSSNASVEVDFIYKAENKTIPIEIKCSQKFDKRHISGIEYYLDLTKQKLGVLVSTAKYEIYLTKNKIINIPVYLADSGFINSNISN